MFLVMMYLVPPYVAVDIKRGEFGNLTRRIGRT